MTDRLFQRQGRLLVTKKAGGRNVASSSGGMVFNTRLTFAIASDLSSFSNKSSIKIYNLSTKSQAFLEQDNLLAILQVGYLDQGFNTIFIGDIDRENGIHTQRVGPDVVTDIECGDAETEINNAVVSLSYKGRVTTNQIINRLLGALNLSIGFRDRLPEKTFENGYSNSGRIQYIMNDLARKVGFTWSVQNGQIVILRPNRTITQTAFVVSKDTGLFGAIVKTKEKVEFTVLITPEIRVGRAVRLITDQYGTMDLKINKVNYNGDTHEGEWSQQIEGQPI